MAEPTDGEPPAAATHVSSSYQVALPEPFKLSKPEQWPKWIRRFEHFRSASGLAMKDGKVQVDTLLYAMGSDADDVMLSFHLREDDACDYGKVKDRFDRHFVKKRNVIYERARFNTRCQGKDESVDAFVTALHSLAQYCNYKELHDEMIRDRLVVGLRDAKLSEKLQLDADLTLETALTKARQSEAVHQQQAFLRGKEDEVPVASVNRGKRRVGGQTGKTAKKGGKTGGKTLGENCPRCGKTPSHARQQCPARDVKCNSCGKIGHYSRVCRSSEGVKEVKSESMDETEFMGAISSGSKDRWEVTLQVRGQCGKLAVAKSPLRRKNTTRRLGFPSQAPNRRPRAATPNGALRTRACFGGVVPRARRTAMSSARFPTSTFFPTALEVALPVAIFAKCDEKPEFSTTVHQESLIDLRARLAAS